MCFDPAQTIDALAAWDVIYPYDNLIDPKKHKMWVCMSKENLWFLRINSLRYKKHCVVLPVKRHAFLDRDSFIGCGGDLIQVAEAELHDLLTRQGIEARQGIVGQIHQAERPAICAALRACTAPAISRTMARELGCAPDGA